MSHPEFHVYIAGPFSPTKRQRMLRTKMGHDSLNPCLYRECVEENIIQAKLLGIEVAKLGVYPVIPHANSDHEAFTCQPYGFWIKGTLEQMRRCNAVLFTDNWMDSDGAIGEHDTAMAEGIKMFFSLNELKEYVERYLG